MFSGAAPKKSGRLYARYRSVPHLRRLLIEAKIRAHKRHRVNPKGPGEQSSGAK